MNTNNINNSDLLNSNSIIQNSNTFIKSGLLALAIGLSSNQLSANAENTTITTKIVYQYDGAFSYAGTFSNIQKPNFIDRYSKISTSNWFSKAYNDRSLGEIIGIEQ